MKSPERIPPAAAAAPIEDLDGRVRRLDALWADETVVVVFLRHFG